MRPIKASLSPLDMSQPQTGQVVTPGWISVPQTGQIEVLGIVNGIYEVRFDLSINGLSYQAIICRSLRPDSSELC